MLSMFFAIVLVQPSPSPAPAAVTSPAPALSPAWKKAALEKNDYAHYVRPEQDGTQSELIASRQVCDCQPLQAMAMFKSIFNSQPGASVTNDTVNLCGALQTRLIVTGIASPTNSLRNGEFIIFRREPAMYMFEYTFRYAKPMPDAESALAALCP